MGQLVDGKWSTKNVLIQHDDTGLYFKRDSLFRKRTRSCTQFSLADRSEQ